jgi:hypothetical protein
MKVSMQMLRELGVCDGADQYIGNWFVAHNVETIDYEAALNTLLQYQDAGQDWIDQNYPDTDHSDFVGWVKWMRDLPLRYDAITYFGDHIAENLFRTADGHLHETLLAAQDHRRRMFAELRQSHAAARVINGVKGGATGAETWEVVDLASVDLAAYDAFVWHDSTTGLNHRTQSAAEAVAFDAEQAGVLEAIDAAETAAQIERRITDESGTFHVWIPALSTDPAQTEG